MPDNRDTASKVAGSDGEQRAARNLLVAIALPTMSPLLGLEEAGLAKMHQQCHERPFGQGTGMDATSRGDDDVRLVEASLSDHFANATAGGLKPLGVLGVGDVSRPIRGRDRA